MIVSDRLTFKLGKVIKITAMNARVFWLRIALTIFGIFIGVASVIATFSLNRNMELSLERQINEGGGPTMTVETRYAPFLNKVKRKDFAATLPGIEKLFFISQASNVATLVDNQLEALPLYGVDLDFLKFKKYPLYSGRLFDPLDRNKRVIVIGQDLSKRLFGQQNPIGKYLVVKVANSNISFRVIGILDEVTASKMSIDIAQPNTSSYIPLSILKAILDPEPTLSMVIKPDSVERFPMYNTILTRMFDNSGSELGVVSDVMKSAEKIRAEVNGIFFAGLIVGILSLINGGVGIMNIMLVSIMQRKKEIGLYKTFGFTNGLITLQFTAEALFISLLGAVAGVIAGIPLSGIISKMLLGENMGADPLAVLIGFTFTVLIGLVFGIVPARKAAQLDPVTSIKGT